MELTVLADNHTLIDQYFYGEPALSFYIESNHSKILFDTGYSDVFIRNAEKLEIDLSGEIDIVLSHGHNDHTGGLSYLKTGSYLSNKRIIGHPDVFLERIENGLFIGSPLMEKDLTICRQILLSKTPFQVDEQITFLGEIPEIFEFEKRHPMGTIQQKGIECEDKVMDDSALVYHSSKGLFIITGCSHSGICNIIEYAKSICDENRIFGVIGGFHLFDVSSQLNQTIQYLKNNHIQKIYPCHCISLAAKAEMYKEISIQEVGVGMKIEI